ncbi:hypothetical protein R3P38DRAFT_3361318 [Favolaschia claudopus]|uniref:SWIM-type domain-containing protein n=1 Tax=Favolaschia claudopus TaxID=2862362 RepID=A0AAW0AU49_9AGAR
MSMKGKEVWMGSKRYLGESGTKECLLPTGLVCNSPLAKCNPSTFRLDRSIRHSSSAAGSTSTSSPISSDQYSVFRAFDDPAPAPLAAGSFSSDVALGTFNLRWENWHGFERWLGEEQRRKGIELSLVNTYLGEPEFSRKLRYVCSRAGTGGIKTHVKKFPERERKIPNKRTDCKCRLIVKQYPGVSVVLGDYRDQHDHSLGNANLPFTQIPRETREYIAGLLRLKVDPDHILRLVHRGVYDNDNLFEEDLDDGFVASRTEFIQGKFLHGKRNRRLDHLLYTLIADVAAYYALKQRRRDLGFEGPDLEVKKRKAIIKRSRCYQKKDIQQLSDVKFLVPSESNPSKTYEVDIDSYSCQCLDYPLICFCKHLCAVQTLSDDEHLLDDEDQSDDSPAENPDVLALSQDDNSDSYPEPTEPVNTPHQLPPLLSTPSSAVKSTLTSVAEKLERLAGRLRHRKKATIPPSLPVLEAAVDALLLETDSGGVLPSAQDLPPNISSGWKSTQRAMMPGIKTKRIPAGDPSYGAGASSGSKAIAKQKKAVTKKATQSTQPPSLPVPAAIPPVLSVPGNAPPFPTAYPSPLHYPLPQGHQSMYSFHHTATPQPPN